MTQDELVEIREAMTEVMQSEMKSFYVEREQHYLDHSFVCDIREGTNWLKQKTCKASVWSVVLGVGWLMVWSVRHLFKEVLGKL